MLNDDTYYRCLAVMDRIEECRIEAKIKKTDIGKIFGKRVQYYYSFYNGGGGFYLQTVKQYAKLFNVNVGYLLSGQNKSKYKEFDPDYSFIIKSKLPYCDNNLACSRHYLKKHPNKDLTVKVLFDFEEFHHIPAIQLIKGY